MLYEPEEYRFLRHDLRDSVGSIVGLAQVGPLSVAHGHFSAKARELDRLMQSVHDSLASTSDEQHRRVQAQARLAMTLTNKLVRDVQEHPELVARPIRAAFLNRASLVYGLFQQLAEVEPDEVRPHSAIDLKELLSDEHSLLQYQGTHVKRRLSSTRVLGDREQLVRLFQNITNNALEHNVWRGNAALSITVRENGPDGVVRFTSLNARPLDEDLLEMMNSGTAVTTKTGRGHGIGLSSIRRTIAVHNGTFKAFNDRNRPTIEVTLPRFQPPVRKR
ncbi:hypothetical protein AUJ14_01915 [Candidatus Micrarchaeota archaeon CG1_02_55_22]|nr:MAG: hypothetical protein AUJ14_01915 [Candidatus Micrarchaeota archaeon CG1_02_55_22]